jgi:hypothetical protein
MGLREYQFAGFTCKGHPRVFGICKLGPDVDQFDSFVKTLAAAIRASQESGDGAGGHTQDPDPAADPQRETEEG